MKQETLHARLLRKLKPFENAENCQENRDKLIILIKEELPEIPDDLIFYAVKKVMGGV